MHFFSFARCIGLGRNTFCLFSFHRRAGGRVRHRRHCQARGALDRAHPAADGAGRRPPHGGQQEDGGRHSKAGRDIQVGPGLSLSRPALPGVIMREVFLFLTWTNNMCLGEGLRRGEKFLPKLF